MWDTQFCGILTLSVCPIWGYLLVKGIIYVSHIGITYYTLCVPYKSIPIPTQFLTHSLLTVVNMLTALTLFCFLFLLLLSLKAIPYLQTQQRYSNRNQSYCQA